MKNNPEQSSFLRAGHFGDIHFQAKQSEEGAVKSNSEDLSRPEPVVGIEALSREALDKMLEQIDETGYATYTRPEIEKRLRELDGQVVLAPNVAAEYNRSTVRSLRVPSATQIEMARHGKRRR